MTRRTPIRGAASWLAALLLTLLAPLVQASDADVMRILHMLDYIGVDYGEFVQNGEILSELEYAEQQNFAAAIADKLAGLPRKPETAALQRDAAALIAAIDARAPGDDVATMTRALGSAVLAAYPVPLAPRGAPDMAGITVTYQAYCSACHGETGMGDGPGAAGLEPAPTNFRDPVRHSQRSVFGLYNVIANGVPDTAMPGFGQFSEEERWALAFHVGQLIYTDAERRRGAELWEQGERAGFDGLATLTSLQPRDVEAAHGDAGRAVMAYLRAQPAAVAGSTPLQLAQQRLSDVGIAYAAGDFRAAEDAALSAYLDGYELAEAAITTIDDELNRDIESQMLELRRAITRRDARGDIEARIAGLQMRLREAESALDGGQLDTVGSFIGSYLILVREGLEALLVLAALLAVLGRAGRTDAVRYVHYGWILALICGGATWLVAQKLITISGAGRELTEGISALIAAAVLLSVGLWMHQKSLSDQWQQYIAQRMQESLGNGTLWGIAALAFIATYREVFETVLFYQALWAQGAHDAIVAGFALASVTLVGLAWVILRYAKRLPIRQFFSISAVIIVVLAVVFTGQGIQALQEAGVISSRGVSFVSVPLLGIYPNLEGLLAQALMVALVMALLLMNRKTVPA